MSHQELDLKRFLQVVRRYRLLVGALALVGLAGGVAYAMLNPPMLSAKAVVVLPTNTRDLQTQVVIAGSQPVLKASIKSIEPPISFETLVERVKVGSVTSNAIAINAQSKSASQAESIANSVAKSYVSYVDSPNAPGGRLVVRVLEPANNANGTPLPTRLSVQGLLGLLAGAILGSVVAMVISRTDRRLRDRDEMADAIGVPVLASIAVSHPASTGDWVRLLEEYRPGVVHGWSMRKALEQLALADVTATDVSGTGASVAIVTLASDKKALAIGPQLAVFAASQGILTSLVIGPQQDPSTTATLRAACAAPTVVPPRRNSRLKVTVADHESAGRVPEAALTIVVAVVDGRDPQVAETMNTDVAVLGVSAGTASAENLAQVAASAAADGRPIAGIFVADPDPADHTTGRMPQPGRTARRRPPTRLTGTNAGYRR
jgi:capsular polysaccharide biosynthesis protein